MDQTRFVQKLQEKFFYDKRRQKSSLSAEMVMPRSQNKLLKPDDLFVSGSFK